MAGPSVDEVGRWLLDNPDKKGTTDYVQMATAYKNLRNPAPAAEPSGFVETIKSKIGLGPAAEGITDPEQFKTAARLTSDPGSVGNTVGRVVTGAVGGLPDLGIAIANAAARSSGQPDSQIDYVTPKLQAASGTAPIAEDASLTRQLLEGAGSAVLGGGAAAGRAAVNAAPAGASALNLTARAVAPTALPVAGAYGGGEAGGFLGKEFGDEETGRLLGSLIGGVGGAASPLLRYERHGRYAGRADPDAPAIAAAAERQGIVPTAGMLGDNSIMYREQRLSGQPGSASLIQGRRDDVRTGIGTAINDVATARGATDTAPTTGTIGEKISNVARESANDLRAASEARQLRLEERVGADSPVLIGPMREHGYDMITDPRRGLSVPSREALDFRLTDQLNPLRDLGPGGSPVETVPYGPFRGWRTDLGKEISTPQGGRMPPTADLYAPATEAMRDTAARQGVNPQDFNNIQAQTRAVERTTPAEPGGPIGDYPTLQRYVNESPTASYNYAKKGFQDPNVFGTLEATGHPQVGEIMGDIIRNIGNETINNPLGGARQPARLAERFSPQMMNPESRAILTGDQAGNVDDIVRLSQALNIPTQQGGLTRALGGQGDNVANKIMGGEVAGHAGTTAAGPLGGIFMRLLSMAATGGFHNILARVLEGPTVRNALSGGPAPSVAPALNTALQAASQQPGAP